MQRKKVGKGYKIYYDDDMKGDIILINDQGSSITIPQVEMQDMIAKYCNTNNTNQHQSSVPGYFKLNDILQLNIIDTSKNIEVYQDSTAVSDMVFEGTINCLIYSIIEEIEAMGKSERGKKGYYASLIDKTIASIYDDEDDITIILLN